MRVRSLGHEDPLETGVAAHSQYSCLNGPMDRGAWKAAVPGVAKSWTRLKGLSRNSTKQDEVINCFSTYKYIMIKRKCSFGEKEWNERKFPT